MGSVGYMNIHQRSLLVKKQNKSNLNSFDERLFKGTNYNDDEIRIFAATLAIS